MSALLSACPCPVAASCAPLELREHSSSLLSVAQVSVGSTVPRRSAWLSAHAVAGSSIIACCVRARRKARAQHTVVAASQVTQSVSVETADVWHGVSARFHSGSIVYVTGVPAGSDLEGEPCSIVQFDSDRKRWIARFLHPRFEGRALLIDEDKLNFGYCVLPGHARDDTAKAKVHVVAEQGSCGRGLAASSSCSEGDILFEERPFLVTADDTFEICRAYFMMLEGSRSSSATKLALDAFYDLSMGNVPESTKRRLWNTAKGVFEAASGGSPDGHEGEVATIVDTLLRWETNRFKVQTGSATDSHALYRMVSRLNHSCTPSVSSSCELATFSPGTMVSGDVRCVVRALLDLEEGASLCLNYGPPELPSWPVEKRRAYLLEHNGFLCQCPRCVEESQAGVGSQAGG